MTTKLLWILLLMLMLTTPVYALRQTSGELVINTTLGGSDTVNYGIVNEKNNTIIVKLNTTGNVSKYISFPNELVLEPNEIKYVNITSHIPTNVSASTLKGIIYATKEGEDGGQVQINVRIGKRITLNIKNTTTQSATINPQPEQVYNAFLVYGIIFIGVLILIIGCIMMYLKNR